LTLVFRKGRVPDKWQAITVGQSDKQKNIARCVTTEKQSKQMKKTERFIFYFNGLHSTVR
jgi:hypothetical protein